MARGVSQEVSDGPGRGDWRDHPLVRLVFALPQ